jgi:PKD repeat protein
MRIRTILGICGFILLAALAGGCDLFNNAPIARIAASVTSGESPLLVTFDASGSADYDGRIVAYRWSFSDGEKATGRTVERIFAPPSTATYTATLEVEDDDGAVGTIEQSIEVRQTPDPGNNPPFTRFTFDPTYGDGPLLVEFDARLTADIDGEVVLYAWDFGDGTTGSGERISHTYDPKATTNYPATLTATDDDGASSSMTAIVSVHVEEVIPIDGPTAELTATAPQTVYESPMLPSVPSLFRVTFNPEGSVAAPGHEIDVYIYTFGDGESASMATDEPIEHTYRSGAPTHTFVVSLTVVDDQGLQDSVILNVTVVND